MVGDVQSLKLLTKFVVNQIVNPLTNLPTSILNLFIHRILIGMKCVFLNYEVLSAIHIIIITYRNLSTHLNLNA